jgi:Leucine-rich repeat (LRR) protein
MSIEFWCGLLNNHMPKISQLPSTPLSIVGNELAIINQNGTTYSSVLSNFTGLIAAAELTSAQIMTKAGEQLIASLAEVRGASNAGTCYFATTRSTSGTFTVKTSTGYARLVNADNTLGAQAGTGNAATSITLTIPASGLHRALGIISVASGGTEQSGDITDLVLNNSQLTTFSGTGLSALTTLDLNSNSLTTFSSTGLSALTDLSLAYNSLTTFSGTGLSALTYLDLNNNSLTTFSGTGLSALTTLILYTNQLTTFSGTGLSALTQLYLAYNSLTTFSGTGLSSLTYLILSSNSLTTFSGTGLSALTTLDLGNNQLTTFSGTGLSALTRLIVNNNQITSIDMAGLVLSYGYSSYGYFFGSIIYDNLLNGTALNAFYTSLGNDVSANGIIFVSGNPGTATDDPTIATAKGYTIIGT